MSRTLFAVVLLSLALGAQAIPASPPQVAASSAAPQRKIPCKVPESAAMCYWTHGRLNFNNGNPAYRIWKVGTNRILGVYSGPNSELVDPLDNEFPEFPANLRRAYNIEYDRNVVLKKRDPSLIGYVFADFEVCPLEPEHPGWMQSVCIESAKNIFVDASKRGYR